MKVCMDEFRSLAARYADLHQSSFDADYATLRNVELYPLTWHLTVVDFLVNMVFSAMIDFSLTVYSDNNRVVCLSPM